MTADLAYWAHDVYLDDKAADFEVARTLVDLGDADLSRVASISKRICIERGIVDGSDPEEGVGLAVTVLLACLIAFLLGMVLRPEADSLITPIVNYLIGGTA